MAINVRHINKLHNNGVLLHDEVTGLRQDIKAGFRKVVEANEKLNPNYKTEEPGAWRKVEDPGVDQQRPLVQTDAERLLKKLDIL